MSYKNIKLNTWTHPTTGEVRVYIDTRYVDHRDPMHYANGSWICADETGMCAFGFKQSANGVDRYISMQAVASFLAGSWNEADHPSKILNMPFCELLRRMAACSTKGGNFSAAKYENAFEGA